MLWWTLAASGLFVLMHDLFWADTRKCSLKVELARICYTFIFWSYELLDEVIQMTNKGFWLWMYWTVLCVSLVRLQSWSDWTICLVLLAPVVWTVVVGAILIIVAFLAVYFIDKDAFVADLDW
ncbi:MAG: hypothetical protein WCW17_03775 [Patescibacteria group bacterium]|jgi:hypothetical protein